jgi:PhnB protein
MTQINAYLNFNGSCREAMTLNCSNEEEINRFFSNRSGGKIQDPLKEQFQGLIFGVITGKFGIRWMLSYDKNQKSTSN